MESETPAQKAIKAIQGNPARFLTKQIREKHLFDSRVLGTLELDFYPIIMVLEKSSDIYLTVTTWDMGKQTPGKVEYQAYIDQSNPDLPPEWTLNWVKQYAPHLPDSTEGRCWDAATGMAASEWRYIAANIRTETTPVYAWFFPYGPSLPQVYPGMVLYASNRDK